MQTFQSKFLPFESIIFLPSFSIRMPQQKNASWFIVHIEISTFKSFKSILAHFFQHNIVFISLTNYFDCFSRGFSVKH